MYKLIILDYYASKVFEYELDYIPEDIESFVENIGYSIDDIHYIFGDIEYIKKGGTYTQN